MVSLELELLDLSPRKRMRKLHLESRSIAQSLEGIANTSLPFVKEKRPVRQMELPRTGNIFSGRNK